jgi:histidyl-tRNA synthetase
MFSGQALPACGFSLGLERILLLMEERGLFPERLAGQPQVLVTVFDAETAPASVALASRLRAAGLQVDLYPDAGGYGRQFKYAEARGIPYAALIGPREVAAGVVAMKDLATGAQEDVPADDVAPWVARRL